MIAALTANHDLLPLVQGCCFQVKHSFYINRARHLLNPLVCPMYLSFLPSRNMDFYFEDRRTISNVAGTWDMTTHITGIHVKKLIHPRFDFVLVAWGKSRKAFVT